MRGLPALPEGGCRSLRNGFPLSTTALHLSRNLSGDLPAQAVGPRPACQRVWD